MTDRESEERAFQTGKVPDLMTEEELIQFLRIPDVSKAKNFHNVVDNLKRTQALPCIHISNKCLYPQKAVLEWVEGQTKGA